MVEDRSSRLSRGVVSGRAKWRHDDEVGGKRSRWRRGGSFSDTQTDFSGFSWVASGLESVII